MNKYFFYFFILSLSLCSCKNKNSKDSNKKLYIEKPEVLNNTQNKKDSLKIIIHVPAKEFLILNIRDKFYENYPLYFKNTSNNDTVIKKTIFKEHNKQIIRFGMTVMKNGSVQNYFKHFYLIDEDTNQLNFKLLQSKDLELLNENKEIIVDELHKKYDSLKLFLKGKKNVDTLKKTYLYFNNRYMKENKKLKLELNSLFYNSLLINDQNDKVELYIKRLKNPIVSSPFRNLFYSYVKENILDFNFELLNTNNESKEFLKNISISFFNFLKNEDNKGDKKYIEVKDWLKTTILFKKDSIYIKKNISPLNNNQFKIKLQRIELKGTDDISTSLLSIIKQNPSNYYLIDFWATWCAPCIGGVKLMNKMDLPNNVRVLSISLDKEKDKNKWKEKAKELKQKYTYWLNEESTEAKTFLKFIELQSIPRYILIDKNFNLVDQAFYHPNEPQFLNKLKNIKNHKYW